MAYSTPNFTGLTRGNYSGNTITQDVESGNFIGRLESVNPNATQLNPNDAVNYIYTFNGGSQQTVLATYQGIYSANGAQYPVFQVGSSDFIVGISGNANNTTYQFASTPYGAAAPCYVTGTRILTDRGEIAVEHLRIGDAVITASGQPRPIKWIGTRSYERPALDANPTYRPVRVQAGSLADGIPVRDLWMSDGHHLFLDGILVAAADLVNGATIAQIDVDAVTYWHIELHDHDILLAEGTPAESFCHHGNRWQFDNAATYAALYPDDTSPRSADCAPRASWGEGVERVRARLAARAGLAPRPVRQFSDLIGHVDACEIREDRLHLIGWARDAAHPDGPVCLDVVVDGTVAGLVLAEQHRADVEAAGHGTGRHGFAITLPLAGDAGAAHGVALRRSADGVVLAALTLPALDRATAA